MFLTFNDNLPTRKKFFSALNTVLEIQLDKSLKLNHFEDALIKMFGEEDLNNAKGSINGDVRFFGLTKTSNKLEGLDKHLKLIESYKKLLKKRKQ
jgi:ribosomal protein S12 methylthiotransferase accessory factor